MSASEMYQAALRIRNRKKYEHQDTAIIYLGDHDPSGKDMSDNDIPGRFKVFFDKWSLSSLTRRPFEIRRIALNWDQIEIHNPPPNPAKETDSRFAAYEQEFGDQSWELDALDPTTLLAIIQEAVDEFKDQALYDERKMREDAERQLLKNASDRWEDIEPLLIDRDGEDLDEDEDNDD